jgi:hypothetical protein
MAGTDNQPDGDPTQRKKNRLKEVLGFNQQSPHVPIGRGRNQARSQIVPDPNGSRAQRRAAQSPRLQAKQNPSSSQGSKRQPRRKRKK